MSLLSVGNHRVLVPAFLNRPGFTTSSPFLNGHTIVVEQYTGTIVDLERTMADVLNTQAREVASLSLHPLPNTSEQLTVTVSAETEGDIIGIILDLIGLGATLH